MTVEGYDLSHWDGINDYSLTGKGFVVIKVTEGSGYKDPGYDGHLAKAKAAGILIGAYHFARDDVNIDDQAKWFVQQASDAAVTFLAVDVEGAHATSTSQTTALISAIRKYDQRDRPVLLYMSDSGFQSAGQDYNWVAKWSSTPPARSWLLWQYMSGSQSGSGGEDRDRYAGSLDALRDILGGTTMTNSYTVPKAPTIGDIGNSKTIWPNDACDPNDPTRIIISPSRIGVPVLGMPTSDKRIIEYVDDKGVHTGKAYWIKTVDLTNVRPLPLVADDGYTKATQDAAVAAQKAADDAACKTAVANATVKAAADQAAADQAAIDAAKAATDKAVADLATAAADERERIALELGQDEADRVRATAP